MKEISLNELKELQMDILDYVDGFCRHHSIHYTISGGTLLGAVRHGGYIPWDDDIDIQMLRTEYNRFTELWNKEKDHGFLELVNIESGNSMGYPFGKIHDTRTVTLIDGLERTGVFIDVFPLDDVVNEDDFIERHRDILDLYKKRALVFDRMKLKEGHLNLKSRIRLLLSHIPKEAYNDIAEEINSLAQRFSTGKHDFVFELVAGLLCKSPIPSKVFSLYKDIVFEDRTYMSVADTDTYLSHTFGDYMTLPPMEKRVSHHGYMSYWR